MSDKVDIIQSVGLQEVLLNSLAELTQFKEGMKDLGVLNMIQEHKDLLRSFYCTDSKTQLDAGMFHYCACI